jgi:hypothetical protein
MNGLLIVISAGNDNSLKNEYLEQVGNVGLI